MISEDNRDEDEKKKKRRPQGPCLPEGISLEYLNQQAASYVPEEMNEDEDGDVIGPAIPRGGNENENALADKIREFDERSEAMRMKLVQKEMGSEKLVRESWMIELPPENVLGLGANLKARQFSKGPAKEKGDRSAWTDTPQSIAERQEKARLKALRGFDPEEPKKPAVCSRESARDEAIAKAVDEYN
eukprot:Ihof_evm4s161 gene=Ihof_evmTU4s161